MANWARKLTIAFVLVFSIGFFVQTTKRDIVQDKQKIEWYKKSEQSEREAAKKRATEQKTAKEAKAKREEEEAVKTGAKISVYGAACAADSHYRLGLLDNKIVVYRGEENQVYEYTNLILQRLPYEEQKKILLGQGVYTERELYEFLETYSS